MTSKYEAPRLTVVGSVEAITAATKTVSTQLDKDFPAGTKFGKLTFS